MKYPLFNWKTAGSLACALVLGASLQAQDSGPSVALRATDSTALTGTSAGAFTLIRHGDTNGDLSVNVEVSGTAVNGVDYTSLGNVFVIPAGYYAVDVTVTPLVDETNRGNKTVVMSLLPDSAYRVRGRGQATVKIVDDVFNLPAPEVSMASPADGSAFTSPASITLQADVSDDSVSVKSVSFYADDDLLGRVTTPPYSFVWNHPRNGKYTVFARAVDEFGKSSISSPIDVTVSDKPVVTLSSGDASIAFFGQIVPLTAQIGDPNEKIQSVSFYLNNKLLGTVTQAPFVLNWTPTAFGTFSFKATAVDKNSGKKADSNVIQITVIPNGGN